MSAARDGPWLERRSVVAAVAAERGDALVVAGLGSPAWDLAAAGDRADNFYLWGGMGQAVPIGLGLALAQPRRRVLVVTGDGEMMMGLGALAVVAAEAPANLAILVLDNERFGETGGQPGLTAAGADLAGLAEGAGLRSARTVRRGEELPDLAQFLLHTPGPVLAVAKVSAAEGRTVYPSSDGALLARRLRAALGVA